MKTVIGACDPMHLPVGRHPLQYFLHQARRAEGVARAVETDHGNFERGQMRITQLIRSTRRMQRIRQQQQPVALKSLRGEHRGGAAAHRAATDDERPRLHLLASARDDGRETLLESRHRVGAPGLLFLVEEVEADDADSSGSQRVRGLEDSAIVHVAAGAVGKNEDYPLLRPNRWLENRRGFLTAHWDTPLTARWLPFALRS